MVMFDSVQCSVLLFDVHFDVELMVFKDECMFVFDFL